MIPDQMVKVKWSNRNKTYYENFGYKNFENGKEFLVDIKHLPLASRAIVKVICDYCGKIHYGSYNSKSKSKNHFCSRKCQDSFLIGKPSWNSRKVIVKCAFCQADIERSEWELKKNKKLFCNKSCANNYMKKNAKGRPKVKRISLNCTQCNVPIERTESELKRAKNHFCSKECLHKYLKGKSNKALINKIEVECYMCKKVMLHTPSRVKNSKRIFCSKECRKKWMNSQEYSNILYRDGLVDVICNSCGITFKKKRSVVSKYNFCSKKCFAKYASILLKENNPNPKKEKIKVNCYTCGTEKMVNESVYKKNKYFFCSYECYQQKRIEISDFKQTKTSIHVKINNLLDSLNITYENEKGFSYYSLDIYLPNHELGVEIMGDYWHGSPIKYKDKSQLNDIQIKNIERDRRKNIVLNKKFKIPILYLWEDDINNRLDICKELILNFIQNNGLLDDYNSFNYKLVNGKLIINNNIIMPYFLKANNVS